MGTIRIAFLLTTIALIPPQISAPQAFVCPITKAPTERFIPPLPWNASSSPTETSFYLGTPQLWTRVSNYWTFNRTQNKLPYFSEQYDWRSGDPPLAVVARRLDVNAPLVWAKWVNGAGPSFSPPALPDLSRRDGAMVTGLDLPSKGCWEISAHLTTSRDKVETLTYTVIVE